MANLIESEPRSGSEQPSAAGKPAPQQETDAWWSRRYTVILALIVALGALARLVGLGTRPLWDDEAFTYFMSAGSLGHLWDVTVVERHPPLYGFVAWLTLHTLGRSEMAMRLPSALLGIALIPVAAGIGRKLWGEKAALLAAAFVSLSPLLVYFSQEARSYPLLILSMLIAGWSFWEYSEAPNRKSAIVAVVANLIAASSHYLGFAVALFGGLAMLRRGRWKQAGTWGFLAALAAVLLPLLALMLRQRQGMYAAPINFVSDGAMSLPAEIVRSLMLLGNGGYPTGKVRAAGYAAFLLGLAITVIWSLRSRTTAGRTWFPLALAVCVFVFLRGAGWALKWAIRDNYMTTIAAPTYLALAGLAAGKVARWRTVLAVVLLGVMVSGTVELARGTGRKNPDFRQSGRLIEEINPDGVLLARSWGDLACVAYYEGKPRPMAAFDLNPAGRTTSEYLAVQKPLTSTDALIRDSSHLCLVGKTSGRVGFEQLSKQLRAAGFQLVRTYNLEEIELHDWKRELKQQSAAVPQ